MLCSSGRRDESFSMCKSMSSTWNPLWGVARKTIAHVRCERKRMPQDGDREDSDFNKAWRAQGSSAAGSGNGSSVIVPA